MTGAPSREISLKKGGAVPKVRGCLATAVENGCTEVEMTQNVPEQSRAPEILLQSTAPWSEGILHFKEASWISY